MGQGFTLIYRFKLTWMDEFVLEPGEFCGIESLHQPVDHAVGGAADMRGPLIPKEVEELIDETRSMSTRIGELEPTVKQITDELIKTLALLRERHRFAGYIHVKLPPGELLSWEDGRVELKRFARPAPIDELRERAREP